MKVMQKYEIIDVPEIEKPGIYAIHNIANDKYYIGSAKNLHHRLNQHWCEIQCCQGINLKMDQDIHSIKDIENFEYIIISVFENGEITNKQLKTIEDEYIKEFDAIEKGYNTYSACNMGNITANEVLFAKQYLTEHRKECVVQLYVPKGMKDVYRERAAEQGMSLNSYINKLLDDDLNTNDKKSPV